MTAVDRPVETAGPRRLRSASSTASPSCERSLPAARQRIHRRSARAPDSGPSSGVARGRQPRRVPGRRSGRRPWTCCALLELSTADVWFAIVLDIVVIVAALAGWVLLGEVPAPVRPRLVALGRHDERHRLDRGHRPGRPVPDGPVGRLPAVPSGPDRPGAAVAARPTCGGSWRTSLLVAAYLSMDPVQRFSAGERDDLLVVVIVAVGASLAGHVPAASGRRSAASPNSRTSGRCGAAPTPTWSNSSGSITPWSSRPGSTP